MKKSFNKIKPSKILVALYSNPERLPPTLNAIDCFSKVYDEVFVFYRAHQVTDWNYPTNVTLIPDGKIISSRQQELQNSFYKAILFIKFCFSFFKTCYQNKPDTIQVCDPIPLFAYYLIRPFLRYKHKIWYHNHDVLIEKNLRKFSISWCSYKVKQKMFPHLDIFSLPAKEREIYFPLSKLKGKYFFIPNFPSKYFYSQFKKASSNPNKINIIFQGSIGTGHGIEQLINLLPLKINGKTVKLLLKGMIRSQFQKELESLISKNNVEDYVSFIGFTPYQEIPKIASNCQIGISIFTKQDVMNRTLGTASNKIYEYTAVGLPMLFYNDKHFSKHLGKMKWAIPVTLSEQSLIDAITYIDNNFEELSQSARHAFLSHLHFEYYFIKIINYLKALD